MIFPGRWVVIGHRPAGLLMGEGWGEWVLPRALVAGASEAAGLPAAEKSGIFWPRATEFIVSIAEMPV